MIDAAAEREAEATEWEMEAAEWEAPKAADGEAKHDKREARN